jgi:hypothetical protein
LHRLLKSVVTVPGRLSADTAARGRRGVMAADPFTQIANGLLRDRQSSYEAKRFFGHSSTKGTAGS